MFVKYPRRIKAFNFDNFYNSHNSFLWPEYFIDFFMWKMDPMSGSDIRLVFTLPPRDSTLQYKRCVHLWNNYLCIIILCTWVSNSMWIGHCHLCMEGRLKLRNFSPLKIGYKWINCSSISSVLWTHSFRVKGVKSETLLNLTNMKVFNQTLWSVCFKSN